MGHKMVQNNDSQQALLDNAGPTYNTSGSWWAWASGSKAPFQPKDRALVMALWMNSDFGCYEARDTVAAALKNDRAAQRKIRDALDNGRQSSCRPQMPEGIKQELREVLLLLAQGNLTQLEQTRAQLRAEFEQPCQAGQLYSEQGWQRQTPGWWLQWMPDAAHDAV